MKIKTLNFIEMKNELYVDIITYRRGYSTTEYMYIGNKKKKLLLLKRIKTYLSNIDN